MTTLRERQDMAARLPWVTRLKVSPGRCEALKYGHMPLKALFTMGGRPPEGTEKYRCKNAAWWRFRALKRSRARDGDYCWSHLFAHGLQHDEVEYDRANRKIAELLEADRDAAQVH